MGIPALSLAAIVSAISSAAGTAHGIKKSRAQKGEAVHAKKKAAAAQREKDRLLKLKETKSPGQRLLGGRPTLG